MNIPKEHWRFIRAVLRAQGLDLSGLSEEEALDAFWVARRLFPEDGPKLRAFLENRCGIADGSPGDDPDALIDRG